MATQRPISDSFHLGASKDSSGNPQPQGSALGPTGNPSLPGQTSSSLLGAMGTVRDVNAGRPASEVYLQNAKHQSVSEAELIDRWFEDLAHFEKTLDELASASLDPSFKDELMAIEQWFLVLSEAERTASLYALLQHISPVQVRFFLTTLQQLAQRNPMTALLTSGAPYAGDDKDSGAKGASLGMLDRHSISGSPVGLGKPGQQRMSATAASLAGVSKNLGLNPNLSLPNATSTFSNRWSLSSLAANNNSAGTMEPIGRPSSLMGSGEALSSGLWRRTDLGMDAGKVNSGSRGKTAGNLHLRPDRPGSALGGEMASLSNNTWGFSSSSNIVGMNESQPPVTERPKSATDFDLTPDWRAVSNSNRSSRNINEPEIKSSLRQSLGDDSNILGEHRAAGKIGVNSGVTTNIPGEPPAAGGSLAARRLGAHKFSVATYDSSDGQISVALKSPLKSPMFAGGLKGTRATGSRPTTPALPPGFYQHPQSPWGLNSNAPPGGVVDMGSLKQAIPPLTPTSLRNPSGLLGGESYNGNGGPYNHPHLTYHHRINSPVRSKFPFNQSGGPHAGGHPSGSSAAGGHQARAQSPAASSGGFGNAGGANKANRGQDQLDPCLLEDIPGWLRSLRLHKYTQCFQDMHWKDMVNLTDEELTIRGVAALGARRKMLKVFDTVKQDMITKGAISAPLGYEASASATTTPSLTPSTQPAQLPTQNETTGERLEPHTFGETVKSTDP